MFDATKVFSLIAALVGSAVILSFLFGSFGLAFWAAIGAFYGLRVVLMTCNSFEARDRKDFNKVYKTGRPHGRR